MPAAISDFLLQPTAGLGSKYVRLTNKRTSTQYVVPATTTPSGRWDWTTGIPAGTYVVDSAPSSLGPWSTLDSAYVITTPYGFNISDYPGFRDDGGDVTAAILAAAADAATSPSGGEVIIPAPKNAAFYGLSAMLPFYSKVGYVAPPMTELKWIAGAPAVDTPMMGSVAVLGQHLDSPYVRNLRLNAGSLPHLIPMQVDSVYQGFFENIDLRNANGPAAGNATQYALKLLSSVGTDYQNNTTMCVFNGMRIDSCRRGIMFKGLGAAGVALTAPTNNYFYGASLICTDAWIDFLAWCDSNYFHDYVFGAAFDSTSAMRGITAGDNVTDLGVHSERFNACSLDFNAGGTMPGAIGIVLNICASMYFQQVFSGIGNVGGITTFEDGTLFQNNNCESGEIEWINQAKATGQNRIIVFDLATGTSGRRWLNKATDITGIGTLGATSGNPAQVRAISTDVDAPIAVSGQGTGGVSLAYNRPNWIDMVGAASGSAVQMQANGVDANIPIHIAPRGTGYVRLNTQLANYVAVKGAAAASFPTVLPEGSDANITLLLQGKGTSGVQLGGNQANFINASGASTTNPPFIAAGGSDANVGLILSGQGTGSLFLLTNFANRFTLTGAAGGAHPVIAASGSDADINVDIAGKGVGVIRLAQQMANFLSVSGAAGAAHPELRAAGSDANINLRLVPKGTGIVDFVYAVVALGGGAAPTFGTIGGTGPAAAAQNSWLKVRINATDSFIPIWR